MNDSFDTDSSSLKNGQTLFILLFFGGVIIKVFADRFGHANSSSIVLCAFLVIYALLIGRSQRFKINDDRAGDNVYYLGFLYTLVSLAMTLYQFQPDTADGGGVKLIIANFGTALLTTIVGLILRIFFILQKTDLPAADHEVQFRLTEAVKNFSIELEAAILGFSSYRTAVHETLAVEFREQSAAFGDKLIENMNTTLARFNEITGNFTNQFSEISDNCANLKDSISKLNSGLQESYDQTCKLYSGIEPLLQSMNHTASSLNRCVSDFSNIGESVSRNMVGLKSMQSQQDQALEQLNRLSTHTASIVSEFETVLDLFQNLRINVQDANHTLEAQIKSAGAAFTTSTTNLNSSTNVFCTNLEDVSKHLSTSYSSISNSVQTAGSDTIQNLQAISTVLQKTGEQLNSIQETVILLKAELKPTNKGVINRIFKFFGR